MSSRKSLLIWYPVFLIALLVTLCAFLHDSADLEVPPYPTSKIVEHVRFAPASSIIVKALGSDNWPITWGYDDNLYTAWGDGWGFLPYSERKISLGTARITGDPDRFFGVNLASPSKSTESGRKGPKASGLLMVNKTLYMWIRNTDNACLAWSTDLSKTWNWGFRFKESFGCPTFLNIGKSYKNARDEYVYVYSQDGHSAYEPYDQVVLARVHKNKITNPKSYEFFKGFDNKDNPKWSSEITQRGPVFKYPNHCLRIDVIYNPGIRRYLMALAYNFDGGWGIFEAPDPWGPWKTIFHTEKWDVPGTHGYRFPSKWIQNGGKIMYLVFSGVSSKGYDAFCVRKMILSLSTT